MLKTLGLAGFAVFVVAAGGCYRRAITAASATQKSLASNHLRIYIADWANHRVVRMNDMQGNGWVTFVDPGKVRFPVGVCGGHRDRLLVTEQHHGRLFCFEKNTAIQTDIFEPDDAQSAPPNRYAGSWVAADSQGRVYVTLGGEHCLMRIDNMTGANCVTYGHEGRGIGQFSYPVGIAVDSAGRVYVADFDNFRVVRIDDMQGTNWTEFGRYGSGDGNFINPCGICLDRQGRIYVADQGNDRLVRMDDMQGTNWTTIGSFGTTAEKGRLYAPTGVCVDSVGRIYMTECSSNHRVMRIDDMQGTNWTVFGSAGDGFGQFASPTGIYVYGDPLEFEKE